MDGKMHQELGHVLKSLERVDVILGDCELCREEDQGIDEDSGDTAFGMATAESADHEVRQLLAASIATLKYVLGVE
jgi:hypothetical protein